MSSFPAAGAMEAIGFFGPRIGSVFPCRPIRSSFSSLLATRRHSRRICLQPRASRLVCLAFESGDHHRHCRRTDRNVRAGLVGSRNANRTIPVVCPYCVPRRRQCSRPDCGRWPIHGGRSQRSQLKSDSALGESRCGATSKMRLPVKPNGVETSALHPPWASLPATSEGFIARCGWPQEQSGDTGRRQC